MPERFLQMMITDGFVLDITFETWHIIKLVSDRLTTECLHEFKDIYGDPCEIMTSSIRGVRGVSPEGTVAWKMINGDGERPW